MIPFVIIAIFESLRGQTTVGIDISLIASHHFTRMVERPLSLFTLGILVDSFASRSVILRRYLHGLVRLRLHYV